MGHKLSVSLEIRSKEMLRWVFKIKFDISIFSVDLTFMKNQKHFFQTTFYIILNTGGISLDTTEIEIDLKLKTWVTTTLDTSTLSKLIQSFLPSLQCQYLYIDVSILFLQDKWSEAVTSSQSQSHC